MSNNYKSTYTCVNCGRGYQRKPYYDRHIICCEILNKSSRERELEEEEEKDTPKLRDLYIMIQELGKQNQDMNKKLDELSKYVEKKKKRLNLVDWLNDNCACNNTYEDWISNLKITRKHFAQLFRYSLSETLMFLFEEIFILADESIVQNIPIKAFSQKENTFFIYTSDKKWIMMSFHKFESFIQVILKLFMDEFKYWQDENTKKMNDEIFLQTYMATVRKLMGGDIPREKLYTQIKNKLYKYWKINLKSVIEYEFN
jgi:hypothetical protein